MIRRGRIGTAIAFFLVISACTGPASTTAATGRSSTTAAEPFASTPSTSPGPVAPPPVPGVGRLAVLDTVGDVVTLRPDGSELRALTDDAGLVDHWQPLWSPSGERLVWAETSGTGFSLVVSDGVDTLPIPMPAMPFFSMWSPNGAQIGVLHNAAGGGLELETVDTISGATEVVATGAPYYFSWSPGGTEIVSHVGGETLSLLGPDGTTLLGETAGDFQTPSWTAAGILHISAGKLVLRDPDGDDRSVAAVGGPSTMVATPDGDRIAVQVLGPDDPGVFAAYQPIPEIPQNAVVVLDPDAGSIKVASSRPSFGFFWSPDGAALLILVPTDREGELEWWVWRDGEIVARVAFVPTESLVRDLLPFFDQYAQAWRPWAPDSSAFAFAGSIDGLRGVWVRDLDAEESRYLIEGDWVAWSAG